ncbi:hypothetical protein UFOVP766_27 [uncultured Caudovirales phage]|uniref:Uncharacterized protein n=1 Tax=uncultured Caudovirales phage TaxID=2100421 RepID=A0A6J5NUS3_9CAUD|nr:hypothetical protein UFOVP766_27 [uncultured Caudovirales phage]
MKLAWFILGGLILVLGDASWVGWLIWLFVGLIL